MTKQFQARQGDILLCEVKRDPPKDAEEARRKGGALVVAVGESSGHRHQTTARGAKLFQLGNLATFLEVTAKGGARLEVTSDRGTALPHVRHGAVELHKGRFEVRRQQEWGPERERAVQD